MTTLTRTQQQTACDGVQLQWTLPAYTAATHAVAAKRSVDGIARENDQVVLHARVQQYVVAVAPRKPMVTVLPRIPQVSYSMAGVRVPRPRY